MVRLRSEVRVSLDAKAHKVDGRARARARARAMARLRVSAPSRPRPTKLMKRPSSATLSAPLSRFLNASSPSTWLG